MKREVFRYRLLEDFDAYICTVGRVQVGKGAEFEVRYYSCPYPNLPEVYFLNTKNYLPMEAVSIFLDHKKEPIHEERLEKSGDSYIYSDSPANINRDRKKMMEERNIEFKDGSFYKDGFRIDLENIYTKQFSKQLQTDTFVNIETSVDKLAIKEGYDDFAEARANNMVAWFPYGSLYHISDFKTHMGSYVLNDEQTKDVNCIINKKEFLLYQYKEEELEKGEER